ncbi:ribbon-helix-helix protein, CopG family [Kribbella sp. NPDC050281]|uniref:ribbon-helix-helix protein, CopG family n=1 Tax=Kribbella sp. NPDC050281 TaxID=3155515 RepID=UPI0033DC074F
MNLRLTPEAAAALQAEAERTGRSQQEIVQEAVDRHLLLIGDEARTSDREQARASQVVHPARVSDAVQLPPTTIGWRMLVVATPLRSSRPAAADVRGGRLTLSMGSGRMRAWW